MPPPRSSRRPDCPSRPWSTACSRRPSRARACSTRSTTRAPRSATALQYFEMFGNRGIYHKGWSAVTKHKTPWLIVDPNMGGFDDDVWELYDGNTDYSQARDLKAEHPEKLAKLQRLWPIEAARNNVLPLDDRSGERLNPDLAGRPTLLKGTSQLFFAGMGRLSENSVVSIKNKSFSITADT